jgi:hypothetical protein
MFIENYGRENAESIMAGAESRVVPYPNISDEDWRIWNLFLPVRSHNLDKIAASKFGTIYFCQSIPCEAAMEIQRASQYFERIEIWRKPRLEKDPIAVGVIGHKRYLIARWGMEKLIPFENIKRTMPLVLACKYVTSPLAVLAAFGGLSIFVWTLLL